LKLIRKEYTDPAEKKKDFRRGVGLWFGLNILVALCSWGASTVINNRAYTPDGPNPQLVAILPLVSFLLGFIPLILNIGLITYFAFTRSQIALGMLAAFGIALVITIILGVISAVACFFIFRSSGLINVINYRF
jgi:hypothetical protein